MNKRETLPEVNDLPTALDYGGLRAEAVSHIQNLSGKIWTDHNAHDPGITTLEILCYALTDLAYRTGFDTVDLLTHPDGTLDTPDVSGLFPAHEVLTTGPRTLNDYRRLLLRIEGLRNAWLDPMSDPSRPDNYLRSEVPVFADCLKDALSFENINTEGKPTHPVPIKGLYQVLVELEKDDLLGSMNDTGLSYQIRRGPLKGVILRFRSDDPDFLSGAISFDADLVSVISATFNSDPLGFAGNVKIKFSGGTVLELTQCIVSVEEDRPRIDLPPLDIDTAKIQAVLSAFAEDDLLPRFWRKQQLRQSALARVSATLHAHRGLCEDVLSVETVAPFRIALCGDIETTPDADLEQVQAQVYRAVESYLAPAIPYRTVSDLLEAGLTGGDIFNGPFIDFDMQYQGAALFTKPGFITDEDLAAAELRTKVQASDLINLIVDIPGVKAIRGLQLRAYDKNGLAVGPSESWTLDIPAGYQGLFYYAGSKLLFHKSEVPYRAQITEFQRTLNYLRAQDRRDVYVSANQVLPLPRGRFRDPQAQYSIQHDFPETYNIGAAGIARSQPPERIAQARQFKAYLTVFDQMLADYLGQLGNLHRLYSLDNSLTRSWFSPALTNIAGSLGDFETEFYTDPAAIADDLTRARLNESHSQFLDRRHRALDHLIARFAERFANYSLMNFSISGDRPKSSQALIADKTDFLSQYPCLSRNRGQAANIHPDNPARIWDSDNISGLEHRLGRLMGIDNLMRRDLHCAEHFAKFLSVRTLGGDTRLLIRAEDTSFLFVSAEIFADKPSALQSAGLAYPEIRNDGAFEVFSTAGTTTWRIRLRAGGVNLVHRSNFDTQIEAVRRVQAILNRYDELLSSDLCNSEGIHLIDHILLRPKSKVDRLMSVCLPEECHFCGQEDPYSFRVSVILPYWPERFRNLHFRSFLEHQLHHEIPAHIQAKICWISQAQMAELDTAHHNWLAAEAVLPQEPAVVRMTKEKLIGVLEGLKTIYPAAELHDCDVGEDSNPVRLGSTALGIF